MAGQLTGLLLHDSVALNFLSCEIDRIIYEKEQKKFAKKPKAIKVQASDVQALVKAKKSTGYQAAADPTKPRLP
jgi:hypothetical protein